MKKIILLLLISQIFALKIYSQEAVINKYYNAGGANSEWTEILITGDNLSLVGYSVRDNSRNEGWQGGVIFKNHPLWKNLRRGTVIVINHRGMNAGDDNKDDGYIEIDAENSTYFTKFMSTQGGLPWEQRAIHLNSGHDMIQIRNASEENVHTLAHIDQSSYPSIDFNNIGGAKLARNGGILNSASVRIVPGGKLSDYSKGFDNSNSWNESDASHSKGFPNQSSSSDDDNSNFWRALRQPANAGGEQIDHTVNQGSVDLSWTAAANDSDPVQGYLLVRIPQNRLSDADNPVDGEIYAPGDNLGSAVVIENIEKLSTDSYSDVSEFDCGNSYVYRLYLYRYNQSDQASADVKPENGRGRSYNESDYKQSAAVTKEAPPKPELSTIDGRTEFCDDEDAFLIVDNFDELEDFTFQWLKGSSEVSDEVTDMLNITQYGSGIYRLVVISENGCSSKSSMIGINIYSKPDALIANNKSEIFRNDTTIQICPQDTFLLRSFSKNSKELIWEKDGTTFELNSQQIRATEEGSYNLIAINENICIDTSITINIEHYYSDYSVTPNPLIIDADADDEGVMTITNNSDEPLDISMINMPPGFSIISPKLPMTIGPGSSVDVTIKYTPQEYGDVAAFLVIFDKCQERKIVDLVGKKINDDETIVNFTPPDGFDFGIISNCHMEGNDSLFINKIGDKETTLYAPDVPAGIILSHSYNFPLTLEQGKPLGFEIIIPDDEGIYSGDIIFDYQVAGDNVRELKIPVNAEVEAPNLTYLATEFDFGLIPECEQSVDSSFTAVNNTKLQIRLEDQPTDSRVIFTNLPIIFEPGDEKVVEFNYTPDNNSENFTFSFWTLPCKDTFQIMRIISEKTGVNVAFDTHVINFSAVNQCELEDGKITINETLNVSGGTATITSVELPDSDVYTVNGLDEEDVISDNVEMEFIFHPPYAATFIDSLVFYYEPCNVRKVIEIRGRLVDTDYTVLPETLNFGFVEVGDESQALTFTITNNGELPLVLDDFSNLATPPFIMTVPSVGDFPIEILPKEQKDFTFRYQPQVPGNDTTEILLNISEPCDMTHSVIFNASSGKEETYNLSVSIPQNIELEASKNGFIPVYFEFDEPENYQEILFDTITIRMSYNPTVILPQGLFFGELTNSDNAELYLNEEQPGELLVRIKTLEDDAIQNGEIIRINTKALVGESQTTDISIDDVSYNTYNQVPVNIETNDGFITVIGECDFENRLVTLDGDVNLSIEDGNILHNSSSVEYSIATSDITTISLYDINGNLVNSIVEGNFQPGDYSAELDISGLSSGVYYLLMKSGISKRYEKIIIAK